jgi:hypothetical protein
MKGANGIHQSGFNWFESFTDMPWLHDVWHQQLAAVGAE